MQSAHYDHRDWYVVATAADICLPPRDEHPSPLAAYTLDNSPAAKQRRCRKKKRASLAQSLPPLADRRRPRES